MRRRISSGIRFAAPRMDQKLEEMTLHKATGCASVWCTSSFAWNQRIQQQAMLRLRYKPLVTANRGGNIQIPAEC